MMSAAILMVGSKELPGVEMSSSDRSEVEGGSFAESLEERIAATADGPSKSTSTNSDFEVRDARAETPLSEGAAVSVTAQGKTTVEEGVGHRRPPYIAAEKTAASSLDGVAGVAKNGTAEDEKEIDIEFAEAKASNTGAVATALSGACDYTDIGSAKMSGGNEIAPDGATPPVEAKYLIDGVATAQKGIAEEEKINTGGQLSKTSESQDAVAAAKITPKTSKSMPKPSADGSKAGHEGVAQINVSTATQLAVPEVPATDFGEKGRAAAATTGGYQGPSTGVSAALSGSVASNGAARTTTDAPAGGNGTVGTAMAGPSGPATQIAKIDVDSARSLSDVATSLSEGDGKPQTLGAVLVHTWGGGNGITAVSVPTAITSQAEVSATKPSGSGTGGHGPANLQEAGLGGDGNFTPSAMPVEGVPHTLMATPTALEIGIQNGTHGWLKVRAEMSDSGAVNASVSAGSTAGQEMLHRELPALTAYLQEEKVAVNTIVVHPTAAAAAEVRGAGVETSAGGEGQMQQRSGQGGPPQQDAGTTSSGVKESMLRSNWDGDSEDRPLASSVYGVEGSWLSVRA